MTARSPTDTTKASDHPVWQSAKAGEPDWYLAALFAAEPRRGQLMALAAFASDVAAIADHVSEPRMGEIRLQWWRDALDGLLKGDSTGSPVADALGAVMARNAKIIHLLKGMVDAHVFNIEGGVMADEAALDGYLEKTCGALFRCASDLLGASGVVAAKAAPAARAAGRAYGITRILRAWPRDAAKGRLFLPMTTLRRHGLATEDLFGGGSQPRLALVLAELASEARQALERARLGIAGIDPNQALAFLPLVTVEPDLARLGRASSRGCSHPTGASPMIRIVRITWAALRGRV